MQIVIDIPEEIYNSACATNNIWDMRMAGFVCAAIANGTPLPKGHGRLIDAEALDMKRIDYIVDGYANDKDDCAEFGMMIILAPTLVEADNAESEEV